MKQKLVLGLIACAALAASAGYANAAVFTVSCANSAASDQAAWSTALGGATFPNLANGSVVKITGICAGDYIIKANATLENDAGTSALIASDGFNGMLEIAGAHVTINGITLKGPGLSPANASNATGGSTFTELADLALHDGAVATVANSQVGPGSMDGIAVLRSSALSLISATISGNGTGSVTAAANLTSGLWISSGSSLRIGAPSENGLNAGGTTATIQGNGSAVAGTSCQGYDILLGDSSSGEMFGAVIGGTSGTVPGVSGSNTVGFNCGAIHVQATGSIYGRDVTVGHIGQFGPAVTAIGGSVLWFDENLGAASPQGSTIIEIADSSTNCAGSGCSTGAILAGGASSVVLQDTGVAAPVPGISGQQPAVDISASSTLILSGGNNICGGALTGTGGVLPNSSTCTATTNPAQVLQADHSSSILHQKGNKMGYGLGLESITGSGSVQVQSSMDLGQGLIGGSTPSINWTLPTGATFTIQQNSSFRLQGGVTISGNVRIQQGSNGFFNTSNGGTNNVPIVCVSSANNPGVHVTGTITGSSSPRTDTSVIPSINVYDLSDVLIGGAHAGLANTCMNF